jgi:hypothetical protein
LLIAEQIFNFQIADRSAKSHFASLTATQLKQSSTAYTVAMSGDEEMMDAQDMADAGMDMVAFWDQGDDDDESAKAQSQLLHESQQLIDYPEVRVVCGYT